MNIERNIQHSTDGAFRARILAAAHERFRQFGFAKTSMQEIAAAAGMSAANLYRFYDGKLEIGAAVAAAEQATLLAGCDRAVTAACPEIADQLVALFQATIDLTRRAMKRSPLLFELGLTVAREKRELRQQFLNEIEARIVAILSGPHPGSAAEFAAANVRSRMILLACSPFVLPWMQLNQPFGNPRPMVEPLVSSLVSGIGIYLPPAAVPAIYSYK